VIERLRRIGWSLRWAVMACAAWLHAAGLAWAEEAPPKKTGGAWLSSYGLVILALALGIAVVCHSSRRRDRAKPEVYADGIATDDE